MTPDTNSYSILIREGIIARVQAISMFSTFTISRSRSLPIQPENLPYFGCYLMDEVLTPDGDAGAGMPAFVHNQKYGMSVIILNNDQEAAEEKIDAAYWAIMNKLLRDPTFRNNVYVVANFPPIKIEGFPRITRMNAYGNSTLENETPIVELRLEMTVSYRSYFEPIITDDFETLHVETRYPTHDTDPEEVQQVVVEYDIPQN